MPTKNNLNIYCDGGARGNPGPAASAFVAMDESGTVIYSRGFYLGKATNNQAEYSAVQMALEWFITSGFSEKKLTFFLDSLLVASQLKGVYKVKDNTLKDVYLRIKSLIANNNLMVLDFVHIPRIRNARADLLVNRILDTNQ
jgi:ribonuclease HI